ncbi:MAG: hypothetical protein U9Q22_01995, partial [Candidatus Altiarchaeota archaeon]|nr:hypothetical protein [Candidatus Altiarchaeota archaeon]
MRLSMYFNTNFFEKNMSLAGKFITGIEPVIENAGFLIAETTLDPELNPDLLLYEPEQLKKAVEEVRSNNPGMMKQPYNEPENEDMQKRRGDLIRKALMEEIKPGLTDNDVKVLSIILETPKSAEELRHNKILKESGIGSRVISESLLNLRNPGLINRPDHTQAYEVPDEKRGLVKAMLEKPTAEVIPEEAVCPIGKPDVTFKEVFNLGDLISLDFGVIKYNGATIKTKRLVLITEELYGDIENGMKLRITTKEKSPPYLSDDISEFKGDDLVCPIGEGEIRVSREQLGETETRGIAGPIILAYGENEVGETVPGCSGGWGVYDHTDHITSVLEPRDVSLLLQIVAYNYGAYAERARELLLIEFGEKPEVFFEGLRIAEENIPGKINNKKINRKDYLRGIREIPEKIVGEGITSGLNKAAELKGKKRDDKLAEVWSEVRKDLKSLEKTDERLLKIRILLTYTVYGVGDKDIIKSMAEYDFTSDIPELTPTLVSKEIYIGFLAFIPSVKKLGWENLQEAYKNIGLFIDIMWGISRLGEDNFIKIGEDAGWAKLRNQVNEKPGEFRDYIQDLVKEKGQSGTEKPDPTQPESKTLRLLDGEKIPVGDYIEHRLKREKNYVRAELMLLRPKESKDTALHEVNISPGIKELKEKYKLNRDVKQHIRKVLKYIEKNRAKLKKDEEGFYLIPRIEYEEIMGAELSDLPPGYTGFEMRILPPGMEKIGKIIGKLKKRRSVETKKEVEELGTIKEDKPPSTPIKTDEKTEKTVIPQREEFNNLVDEAVKSFKSFFNEYAEEEFRGGCDAIWNWSKSLDEAKENLAELEKLVASLVKTDARTRETYSWAALDFTEHSIKSIVDALKTFKEEERGGLFSESLHALSSLRETDDWAMIEFAKHSIKPVAEKSTEKTLTRNLRKVNNTIAALAKTDAETARNFAEHSIKPVAEKSTGKTLIRNLRETKNTIASLAETDAKIAQIFAVSVIKPVAEKSTGKTLIRNLRETKNTIASLRKKEYLVAHNFVGYTIASIAGISTEKTLTRNLTNAGDIIASLMEKDTRTAVEFTKSIASIAEISTEKTLTRNLTNAGDIIASLVETDAKIAQIFAEYAVKQVAGMISKLDLPANFAYAREVLFKRILTEISKDPKRRESEIKYWRTISSKLSLSEEYEASDELKQQVDERENNLRESIKKIKEDTKIPKYEKEELVTIKNAELEKLRSQDYKTKILDRILGNTIRINSQSGGSANNMAFASELIKTQKDWDLFTSGRTRDVNELILEACRSAFRENGLDESVLPKKEVDEMGWDISLLRDVLKNLSELAQYPDLINNIHNINGYLYTAHKDVVGDMREIGFDTDRIFLRKKKAWSRKVNVAQKAEEITTEKGNEIIEKTREVMNFFTVEETPETLGQITELEKQTDIPLKELKKLMVLDEGDITADNLKALTEDVKELTKKMQSIRREDVNKHKAIRASYNQLLDFVEEKRRRIYYHHIPKEITNISDA